MVRRILTYLAIFAAAIVGVALVLNFIMAVFVGGRQVDVPEVRGLAPKEAAEALKKGGLGCERTGGEFCLDYPESTVVAQDPPAGRTVKQGRKVFVTVSLGPQFQEVPYCAGKPLRSAQMFVERSGFSVGTVAWTRGEGTSRDEVITTDPPAGSLAVRGSVVNFLASRGEPLTRYVLPDLRGKLYLPARIEIERLGMFVRSPSDQREMVSGEARVVLQDPPPGYIVATGDSITLLFSSRYQGSMEL
jgi:beta-lactam-binding protein with PASTA domain